jgi:hypothetical protein
LFTLLAWGSIRSLTWHLSKAQPKAMEKSFCRWDIVADILTKCGYGLRVLSN